MAKACPSDGRSVLKRAFSKERRSFDGRFKFAADPLLPLDHPPQSSVTDPIPAPQPEPKPEVLPMPKVSPRDYGIAGTPKPNPLPSMQAMSQLKPPEYHNFLANIERQYPPDQAHRMRSELGLDQTHPAAYIRPQDLQSLLAQRQYHTALQQHPAWIKDQEQPEWSQLPSKEMMGQAHQRMLDASISGGKEPAKEPWSPFAPGPVANGREDFERDANGRPVPQGLGAALHELTHRQDDHGVLINGAATFFPYHKLLGPLMRGAGRFMAEEGLPSAVGAAGRTGAADIAGSATANTTSGVWRPLPGESGAWPSLSAKPAAPAPAGQVAKPGLPDFANPNSVLKPYTPTELNPLGAVPNSPRLNAPAPAAAGGTKPLINLAEGAPVASSQPATVSGLAELPSIYTKPPPTAGMRAPGADPAATLDTLSSIPERIAPTPASLPRPYNSGAPGSLGPRGGDTINTAGRIGGQEASIPSAIPVAQPATQAAEAAQSGWLRRLFQPHTEMNLGVGSVPNTYAAQQAIGQRLGQVPYAGPALQMANAGAFGLGRFGLGIGPVENLLSGNLGRAALYTGAMGAVPLAAAKFRGEDAPPALDPYIQPVREAVRLYDNMGGPGGQRLRDMMDIPNQEGRIPFINPLTQNIQNLGTVASGVGNLATGGDPLAVDTAKNLAHSMATGAGDWIQDKTRDNPNKSEADVRRVRDQRDTERRDLELEQRKPIADRVLANPNSPAGSRAVAQKTVDEYNQHQEFKRQQAEADQALNGIVSPYGQPRVDDIQQQIQRDDAMITQGASTPEQLPQPAEQISPSATQVVQSRSSIPPNVLAHMDSQLENIDPNTQEGGHVHAVVDQVKDTALKLDQAGMGLREIGPELNNPQSNLYLHGVQTLANELPGTPEQKQQLAQGMWQKLGEGPNGSLYQWLMIGGLGIAAISLLSSLFGGGDDEDDHHGHSGSGFSHLAPLLGLGGLAAAGYGATGGDLKQLGNPDFYRGWGQQARSAVGL